VPARRAARIGDGLIAVPGPGVFEAYTAARAEYGRTGPNNLCTFAFSYAADDPEKAEAELAQYVGYRMSNYAQWYGEAGDLATDRALLENIGAAAPQVPMFTDLDTVKAQLGAYEAMGVTSVLWFGTLPGTRPSATLPFFEQIAKLKS
jgi:hypothetical protein